MAFDTEEKEKSAGSTSGLLQGDHAAFEDMVRRETPRLYRVILRIVGDEDEAQSLVQETFLQAYKSLEQFRGEAAFSTWLIGIGINQARAERRKRTREDVLSEEEIERLQPSFQKGRYVQPPRAWNPARDAERAERRRIVHEAIERLPESYHTVIVLRDLEELSTRETARTLGISPGNVRVRLHRARKALRTMLEERLEEDAS